MILFRDSRDDVYTLTLEVGDVLDLAVPEEHAEIHQLIDVYSHGREDILSVRAHGERVRLSLLVRFIEIPSLIIFAAAVRRSKYLPFLTDLSTSPPVKGTRLFLTPDRRAGFAITPEGDLCNVFNNGGPRGAGKTAIARAIQEGAITLDAYDGFLTNYYEGFGFRVVARMKFKDEYAHPEWDYATFGKPDVVFMALDPPPDMPVRTFRSWDRAKAYARKAAVLGVRADLHRVHEKVAELIPE